MDIQETSQRRILMVWVDDMCDHPLTLEVLHQVFCPHGFVEKIVMFPDSDGYFDALIQFHSQETAVSAMKFVKGRKLHGDCCQLDIELSSDFKDLQVFANNKWSRDFTKPCLPSEQIGTSFQVYQNYGFIDFKEPAGCNAVKDCYVYDGDLITEIGRTMKKLTANVMNMLEGVTVRLVQLEDSVDDLKASLKQVHTDVQVVSFKQERLEAQLQPKAGQQSETQISGQVATFGSLQSHPSSISKVDGGSYSSSSKSNNIWFRMTTWFLR